MPVRHLVAVAIPALALTACVQTSGVMQLGPNTYSVVTSDEIGGVIGAKKSGLQEAATYCAGKGREMVAMQSKSDVRKDFVGDDIGHHDLTFRCLPKGISQKPVVGGYEAALIVQ
ncbi:hypothetical protein BFN67_03430 [Pseudaminobacter manganicus]|uniref:Lipoprotein n=1 Tax=Manganibacter manganicus TaxID=1873176 RepID=A0A1V8RNC3_9HYPH|nr:hypothetical protein BFN67_03430 [Pseudaminobacter manganicus]